MYGLAVIASVPKLNICQILMRFVVVFYWQAQWKKSKKIFKIRHIQIDELPRTFENVGEL